MSSPPNTSISNHSAMDLGVWQYAFFIVPIFSISSAYWNWNVANDYTSNIQSFWTRTIVMEVINSISAFGQITLHFLGKDNLMLCIWGKTIQVMLEFAAMWSI
jgi:hypothetical protein